jgi:hypothetical protein
MTLTKEKYRIVIGRRTDGTVKNPQYAGDALKYEGETYFVVKFSMFPITTYYLRKDPEAGDRYTLFSRKFNGKDGKPVFRFAVGSGQVTDDLRTHLEIQLPILGTSVFMSLVPET